MSYSTMNTSQKRVYTSVLTLSAGAARKLFLDHPWYSDLDLPAAYDFTPLLRAVSTHMGNKHFSSFCASDPKSVGSAMNYTHEHSRGGGKSRSYCFLNPVLYVSLVHELTRPDNWDALRTVVRHLSDDSRIFSGSLPTVPEPEHSLRATNVRRWFHLVEQRSISATMRYPYLATTDIENFYPSIQPSILRSLADRREFPHFDNGILRGFYDMIEQHVALMGCGQDSGLPVGCPLMELISELLLAYIDQSLVTYIDDLARAHKNILDVQIIRYRDDYRIHCDSFGVAALIIERLKEELDKVGLKLSDEKTRFHEDPVTGAVKPDKIASLMLPTQGTLLAKLQCLHAHSLLHPNSGSVVKGLTMALTHIDDSGYYGNAEPIAAVICDIMAKNPRSYPVGCALLSRILTPEQFGSVGSSLRGKVRLTEHSSLFDVWFQRLAISKEFTLIESDSMLVQLEFGKIDSLWDTSWLAPPLADIVRNTRIVQCATSTNGCAIPAKEVCLFPPKHRRN